MLEKDAKIEGLDHRLHEIFLGNVLVSHEAPRESSRVYRVPPRTALNSCSPWKPFLASLNRNLSPSNREKAHQNSTIRPQFVQPGLVSCAYGCNIGHTGGGQMRVGLVRPWLYTPGYDRGKAQYIFCKCLCHSSVRQRNH